MKDWIRDDVFRTWNEAHKRLWEGLTAVLPAVQPSQSADLWRDAYLNNLATWESAVKRMLAAETVWVEQLAKQMTAAHGLPDPVPQLSRQMEDVMRRWVEAQTQLWDECFELLKSGGKEGHLADSLSFEPPPVEEAAPPAGEPPVSQEPTAAAEDDLQAIAGIGPATLGKLHTAGILSYRQMAALNDADINRIETEILKSRGRIRRDDWVGQARELHFQKYGERL